MLEALLPNGTDVYVALLTTIPTAIDGTGIVEAAGSGYARKAHNAWTTVALPSGYTNGVAVANNGAVTFDAVSDALTGLVGWAVYDADTAGNLLAFGAILDVGGSETEIDLALGDQFQFASGTLIVGVAELS